MSEEIAARLRAFNFIGKIHVIYNGCNLGVYVPGKVYSYRGGDLAYDELELHLVTDAWNGDGVIHTKMQKIKSLVLE